MSVVDSDPDTGVFPVACPPHRRRPGARALTRTRCLRRHPPPSRSTEAETSHAEVKLGNGTVFGADAAFDFSNAQVKKVDKTVAITNHAEIKDGDSGQVRSANGTVQVGVGQAQLLEFLQPPQCGHPAGFRPSSSRSASRLDTPPGQQYQQVDHVSCRPPDIVEFPFY